MDHQAKTLLTENREPDFQRLLTSLRHETLTSLELSDITFLLSNQLKEISPTTESPEIVNKEPEGVIEMLWAEVFKVRQTNNRLQRIVDHLQEIIGY
jgi:hypothetical protein